MMFLQYAIWGAWLPILFPFLMGHRQFSLEQVSTIFAAGAAGAIAGPFIAGQIADRWFATERFLALSHALGAVLVWLLATTAEYTPFLVLSTLYGLVYSPTIALTNSLAFHHLPDRDRDFGKIRLWGTIGWIAAGIAIGHWLANRHTPAGEGITTEAITAALNAGRADAFRLSAILGAFMSIFALSLPHTPPAKNAAQANATMAALMEFGKQPLLTLFLLAVPVSCIHQFYFVHTSSFLTELQVRQKEADSIASSINTVLGVGGGGLMTIGQMTEIAVLALIPVLARSVSRKQLLAVGLIAYALRMALFAYTDSMLPILFGVALHGFSFGCFVFVAFMVVDEETTSDVRASAQNLFNLVIVGVGIIVGSKIAGWVAQWATVDEKMDYTRLFSVPMWAALGCLAILLAAYPRKSRRAAALSE